MKGKQGPNWSGTTAFVQRGDIYGDEGSPPVVQLHGGGQTRHAWGTTASVLTQLEADGVVFPPS